MSEDRDLRELSQQELAQHEATDLPDRENMSLVNANIAAPINAAIAANVLSDNSTAQAAAIQNTPIDQSMFEDPAADSTPSQG
jgi:hypothetical protein